MRRCLQVIVHAAVPNVWVASFGVLMALTAPVAIAQRSTPEEKSKPTATAAFNLIRDTSSQDDSASIAAAAAKADTGRMVPGYRDLSRYNTPGYCLAAIQGVEDAIWRRNERDTLSPGISSDTLPTASVRTGQACMARLKIDQVRPEELFDLMKLSVLLGDTATLRTTIDRQFALTPSAEKKGYFLLDVIKAYLDARPLQRDAALSVLERLDALGKDARIPRLLAHSAMHHDAISVNFDTTAIIREHRAIASITSTLTPQERDEYSQEFSMTVMDSVYILWYKRVPNLGEQVQALLDRNFPVEQTNISAEARQAMVGWVVGLAAQVGKPVPPLTGKFWFPNSAANARPAKGKVTILYQTHMGSGLLDGQMAILRRMHDKYASQGLEIVLILKTQGYSWGSPPQSPADEAKTASWYYHEYLKLPFTLMVDETPYTRRPDGRRQDGRIAFEQQYLLQRMLVGRDGNLFTHWIGFESETQLDALIHQALEQNVAQSQ